MCSYNLSSRLALLYLISCPIYFDSIFKQKLIVDSNSLRMKSEKPVTISYTDYKEGKDLNDAIGAAFGKTGLGLVVISDLPDFQKERYAALRSIRQFANLPDEVKDKYTHPQSNYR